MKLVLSAALRRPLLGVALGAALCASLQGCVPLVVGATAVGSMAAVDRRSLGMQTDDKTIELKGEGRASKITGDKGRVAVTSYNRMVVLSGEVADGKMKAEVQAQIATLGDLKKIENDLEVAPVGGIFNVKVEDNLIYFAEVFGREGNQTAPCLLSLHSHL